MREVLGGYPRDLHTSGGNIMSKILDDAYKALNWMGTNMRPVCINDMDTGYKMELAVKAALDELYAIACRQN